ncbi:hypothetical protein WK78_03220 [Burkholderia cepacia]|nr:hypothetical protein WK78_03220 [Burkholderia cepacia]
MIFLLYWTKFWGFEVNISAKVLLSVSVLWAYVTSLFGIQVKDGWRSWVIYVAGLVIFAGIAFGFLVVLS